MNLCVKPLFWKIFIKSLRFWDFFLNGVLYVNPMSLIINSWLMTYGQPLNNQSQVKICLNFPSKITSDCSNIFLANPFLFYTYFFNIVLLLIDVYLHSKLMCKSKSQSIPVGYSFVKKTVIVWQKSTCLKTWKFQTP